MRLEDFYQRLELKVTISPVQSHQFEQVAHLTQSSADFNLSAAPRSASEIRELLREGQSECWVIEVSDRFGDYGVSGATIFEAAAGVLKLSDFILNCRVLGKKVESVTLGRLARLARERGCSTLHLRYRAAERNSSARDFVRQVGAGGSLKAEDDGLSVLLPVEAIEPLDSATERTPQAGRKNGAAKMSAAAALLQRRWQLLGWQERSGLLNQIATDYQQSETILEAIRSRKQRVRPAAYEGYVKPGTPVEEMLADIWSELLNVNQVGVNDNFFKLGGHSLLATQLISRVRDAFQLELTLRDLFAHPTVGMLAAQVEQLKADGQGEDWLPLVSVERNGPLPLSFSQQRLWFLEQLSPGSPFYNIPAAVRLHGSLDLGVLHRSLAEVVRRHEALRTRFVNVEGEPFQVISPEMEISMPVEDLTGRPEAEREAAVQSLVQQEITTGFNLSEGPLLRMKVARLSEDEHLLVLTMHHIISDGWSMTVFVQELTVLYHCFTNNLPSPLEELGIQYADYAVWQRERLQGRVLEEELSYWRERLKGAPALLPLPTDRPRPEVLTHRGARLSFTLSGELTEGLRELSRRHEVTLFMTLLGALQVLLCRWSGERDVCVGTPIAGRLRREVEGLIGFFINTLVMRVKIEGGRSFQELMEEVKEAALGAYAHQEVPFEKLVEELEPERSMSYTPLFQVMFALQNMPMSASGLEGLTASAVEIERHSVSFDLSLMMTETDEGIIATIDYQRDLWEEATISRMMEHYKRILKAVVANPCRPLRQIPLLDESERRQLLSGFNSTARPALASDYCLHQLFEAQADLSPGAVAIIGNERRLTYSELEGRSNQLARQLVRRGVGPETVTAVVMNRSEEMLAALLAIMKAGGAYLPIEPGTPASRMRMMIEDAGARLVITQQSGMDELSGLMRGKGDVICLKPSWDGISEESVQRLARRVCADNLAYLIYTSGSTGVPKAVMVSHRNLTGYLNWANSYLLDDSVQLLPALTSLSFDASLKQLFAPLLCGKAVWLLPQETITDPGALLAAISAESRVGFNCVPSLWRTMLEAIETGQAVAPAGSLRRLLLGGEAIEDGLLARTRRVFPGLEIFNLYGPTEATANASAASIAPEDRVTIGTPIANTQIYILDEELNVVPVGVPGHLHIGGTGLARGYFNQPALTAERFIPDPYSETAGQRLYRSGDRARVLESGEIEYLGRFDNQVKIRGFRVELGEIEARLREHERVKDCAVIVREDVTGDKRLVAYLVIREQEEQIAEERAEEKLEEGVRWREYLRKSLPEYMVPQAFVIMERLPLTESGKVDRRGLPEPSGGRAEGREYVGARNRVEEEICAIWAEVLRVERVGVKDNFFELGGHSLLATQVIARVQKAFLVEVPLRVLFEHPTVSLLAEQVSQLMAGGEGDGWKPIPQAPRGGALPLSFAQQRLWFLDQLNPNRATYNIPTAVRLKGALDVTALEQALSELIKRHESLRTTFDVIEGQPAQLIHTPAPLKLSVADLSHLPEAERETEMRRLAQAEARYPFNLSEGPLLRMKVARLSEDEHLLVLTMHHIISDGWSMTVFVQELTVLYHCFTNNLPSPLEELGIQYADYAVWQRERLQGRVLEEELSYWRKQLEGASPLLALPTDKPRPAVLSHQGARHSFTLTEELTRQVRELSRRQGATLFMTLLGAFQLLLSRYSGESDVVVGTPIAGRLRRETEGLIGFFINTLVMRVKIDEEKSFLELLKQVREVSLGAYAHQEVPFEKLVEELEPERSMSYTPLFQVMFVLQNALQGAGQSPSQSEWALSMLESERATAKFDLTLSVLETEGEIIGTWEYSTDLFHAETLARLTEYFVKMLKAVAANPAQPLWQISLLDESERERLLLDLNRTSEPELSSDACLHQLFDAQAARSPQATAIISNERRLTYSELERRSNQLARYLRSRGVRPEAAIAVLMTRSPEMIIALLGIMKAGGAYLPIEPTMPAARMRWMLREAQAKLIITERRMEEAVAGMIAEPENVRALEVISVDELWEKIDEESDEAPEERALSDNLAYLIYTSGSTGVPKAVMVSHRAICNHLRWRQQQFPLNAGDRFLQKASFSFDISVWEIFGTLAAGAVLVLAEPGGQQDSDYLVKLTAEQQVTVAHFGPAMLEQFLAQPGVENCRSLRHVFCGGESLSPRLLERFYQKLDAALHHQYGPTEATVDATVWSSEKGELPAIVPIGRAIANTQIYILDEHLQPVPVGVPGHLHIGGMGLARGYFNQPALTAERFIPDPYSETAGQRLYRSGDRARVLESGEIEYLGRFDNQVKIRGFRVELGEIESVLREHSEVRDCAVLLREDVAGDKRLVAYVVSEGEQEVATEEWRSFLQQRLPEYMLPQAFVTLEHLPLTESGKVDRRALPAPTARRQLSREYVAARNSVEEVLCRIWAEVLRVERVGVEDNFFELGGHSLLATQVITRVRETFQAEELPLRRLFEEPTVSALARSVAEEVGSAEIAEEIAKTIKELEQYSAEEVAALLAQQDAEGIN